MQKTKYFIFTWTYYCVSILFPFFFFYSYHLSRYFPLVSFYLIVFAHFFSLFFNFKTNCVFSPTPGTSADVPDVLSPTSMLARAFFGRVRSNRDSVVKVDRGRDFGGIRSNLQIDQGSEEEDDPKDDITENDDPIHQLSLPFLAKTLSSNLS